MIPLVLRTKKYKPHGDSALTKRHAQVRQKTLPTEANVAKEAYEAENKVLALAYSDEAFASLPSALEGLTAEFGMGSGVTPPLEAPGHYSRMSEDSDKVM